MAESPVKVLLWAPRGAGSHYNGPASFTSRLYSSAPKGRVTVTLAHGASEQEYNSTFIGQHYIANLGRTPLQLVNFIRRGYRWLDNNVGDFEVMHAVSAYHSSVLPAARAQRRGLPAVVFVSSHNTQLSDKGGLKRLLNLPRKRRALVKELSGLIAMSEAIYQELRGYGIPEDKIARIPMGVNTEVFRPAISDEERRLLRTEAGWLDLPTVLFVGGIVRRKRPDLLIEAVALLKRRGIGCQLAIVGPPLDLPYSAQMKRRAEELNIKEQVVWFGFTRDIARVFRAADFFGLPSNNEGMSAALIEAMASGLPAIVTPTSGMVDAVEEGKTGRIVPPDAQQIADALAGYILDSEAANAHGRAARSRVEQYFSNASVFGAYERLFRRVMAGGPAAE